MERPKGQKKGSDGRGALKAGTERCNTTMRFQGAVNGGAGVGKRVREWAKRASY